MQHAARVSTMSNTEMTNLGELYPSPHEMKEQLTDATDMELMTSADSIPSPTNVAPLPAALKPDLVERWHTEDNIDKTHTNLVVDSPNYQSPSKTDHQTDTAVTPDNDTPMADNNSGDFIGSNTMRAVQQGESAMAVAIQSGARSRRLCQCCHRKCNCSNRLTMAKTKLLLYFFPSMLVVSCFFVLRNQQHISLYTAAFIVGMLVSSYIIGWILIMVILTIFQLILMVRDCVFSCIVKRYSFKYIVTALLSAEYKIYCFSFLRVSCFKMNCFPNF